MDFQYLTVYNNVYYHSKSTKLEIPKADIIIRQNSNIEKWKTERSSLFLTFWAKLFSKILIVMDD